MGIMVTKWFYFWFKYWFWSIILVTKWYYWWYVFSLSDAYGPNTSGYSGYGCSDVNECAACSSGSKYGSACPCSDPTPICMNIVGGYTCGAGTAYGDPHFRV